jgi:heptose I phosphotransferase
MKTATGNAAQAQNVYLRPDLRAWAGDDVFAAARAQQGKLYRSKEGRRTLQFMHNGKRYFLKYHAGTGWKEILKNLFQLKAPVLSAHNEYEAAQRLRALGVNTLLPVAYGERGWNPATRESFLVTEDLANTHSLEDVCRHWNEQPPALRFKRAVIDKLADTARIMHGHGINHRDFYLCHFLLEQDAEQKIREGTDFCCSLIDLHRGQIRQRVPRRWRVKDLGGLLYSSIDAGLRARDYYRFIRRYSGKPLDQTLRDPLWRDVLDNAERLYRKDFGKAPRRIFPL